MRSITYFVRYKATRGVKGYGVATASEAVNLHRQLSRASAEPIEIEDETCKVYLFTELLALASSKIGEGRKG